MAEEQVQTPQAAETADEANGQTVTAEQFAELQKQFEQVKAAQSGETKKVAELTKALEEARADKEKALKSDSDRLAELEQKWKAAEEAANKERLKGTARELLTEAGIKANTRLLERLVGADADETAELVKAYMDDVEANRADIAKKFDRENGRTVSGPKREAPTSYEQLLDMSEEQLNSMDPKTIHKIISDAAKK